MKPEQVAQLDVDECLALLGAHHFGRVAVNDERGPVVLPVNYVFDRGSVVFRTSEGTKLAAAMGNAPATFEIDHVDEVRRGGWSVVVRGKINEVADPDELARLRRLPLEPFAGGERDHYVRILSAVITGRRITVPDTIPRGWFTPPDLGHVWRDADADDLGL